MRAAWRRGEAVLRKFLGRAIEKANGQTAGLLVEALPGHLKVPWTWRIKPPCCYPKTVVGAETDHESRSHFQTVGP